MASITVRYVLPSAVTPTRAVVLAAPETAKPITSEVFETSPSLTPNTPARRAGRRDASLRARGPI